MIERNKGKDEMDTKKICIMRMLRKVMKLQRPKWLGSEHMSHSAADNKFFKLKWDAMHSYMLDLIEGPMLGMSMWEATLTQSHGHLQGLQDLFPRCQLSL